MGKDLAQRTRQNNEVQANGGQATIQQDIQSMKEQFAMAAPRGAEAVQLIRDALTMVRKTPKLAQCDKASVLGGLMTCAQLGLRPGVLGHAWLLPMWNGRNKRFEATLVIGYQGYVDLVHRSDRIMSIAARTVYTNDTFEIGYGAGEDTFRHVPCLDGPRGEPRLYYAVARIKGGGYALTDPMTHAEMEAHRDKFAMAKTKDGKVVGPWRDNFESMAWKTMILRLVKLLPKSTDLASATVADSSVRVDLSPDADLVHVSDHPEDERPDDGDVIDGHVVEEPPADVDPATGENTAPVGADGWPQT